MGLGILFFCNIIKIHKYINLLYMYTTKVEFLLIHLKLQRKNYKTDQERSREYVFRKFYSNFFSIHNYINKNGILLL